jgi:hypothetical protein
MTIVIHQVDFNQRDVGKTHPDSKREISFRFLINGKEYHLLLTWSLISGKQSIHVNGVEEVFCRSPGASLINKKFEVDNYTFHLLGTCTRPKGTSYSYQCYELLINGILLSNCPREGSNDIPPSTEGDSILDLLYPNHPSRKQRDSLIATHKGHIFQNVESNSSPSKVPSTLVASKEPLVGDLLDFNPVISAPMPSSDLQLTSNASFNTYSNYTYGQTQLPTPSQEIHSGMHSADLVRYASPTPQEHYNPYGGHPSVQPVNSPSNNHMPFAPPNVHSFSPISNVPTQGMNAPTVGAFNTHPVSPISNGYNNTYSASSPTNYPGQLTLSPNSQTANGYNNAYSAASPTNYPGQATLSPNNQTAYTTGVTAMNPFEELFSVPSALSENSNAITPSYPSNAYNGYSQTHQQTSLSSMPMIPTSPPQNVAGLPPTNTSSMGELPSSPLAYNGYPSSVSEPNRFDPTFQVNQQQGAAPMMNVAPMGYGNSPSTPQPPPLSQASAYPQSTSSWDNANAFGQAPMGGSVDMNSGGYPGTSWGQGTTNVAPPFGESMSTMSPPSQENGVFMGNQYGI